MSDFIGATPPLRLWNLGTRDDLEIHGRFELFSPVDSAKGRTAHSLLRDTMASGCVREESLIVESSSGNLDIALARACHLEGVRFLCVVDARTNRSAVATMKACDAQAEVVWRLDPDLSDPLATRRRKVAQILAEIPGAVNPSQYENPANPRAHHEETMAEIADTLDEDVDKFFMITSITGAINGCAGYCAERGLSIRLTTVDAMGSVLFRGRPGRRLIPGFGAGVEPPLAKGLRLDGVIRIDDTQTTAGCWRLTLLEGPLLGRSFGAVAQAFLQRESSLGPGSKVVLLFHDDSASYLNTVYNDDWMRERLGAEPGRVRELAFAPGPAPSVWSSG